MRTYRTETKTLSSFPCAKAASSCSSISTLSSPASTFSASTSAVSGSMRLTSISLGSYTLSHRLWLRFGVLGLPGGMGVDERDREWESRRLRVGLAGRGTSSAAVGVFALAAGAGDEVVRTLDSDDRAALNFFVAAKLFTGVCERDGSLAAEPGTVRSLDDEDWLSGRLGVKGT